MLLNWILYCQTSYWCNFHFAYTVLRDKLIPNEIKILLSKMHWCVELGVGSELS